MITAGVGTSTDNNAINAATTALSNARRAFETVQPKIALLFVAPSYNHTDVYSQARAVLGPEVFIIGSSTAGEIGPEGPSTSPSVVAMLLGGDELRVHGAHVPGAHDEPEASGKALADALADAGVPPDLVVLISDGLAVNPSAVLRGISQGMPGVPVVGGAAGDNNRYKDTFQYTNDAGVLQRSIAAAALSGEFRFSVGVRHGWSPISGPRRVTKAAGAVIHEIEGRPAYELYEEFVGKEKAATLKGVTLASVAMSYPLGIRDASSGEMLLRAPFFIDETGSITCGGEVPEGVEVQLMMGSKEEAIEAARTSARQALDALGTAPKAAIIFSCHVRDSLYTSRDEAKKEIDAIQEVIGVTVPIAGFYTYAEQAPIDNNNYTLKTCNNVNHNETIVIVLLGDKA